MARAILIVAVGILLVGAGWVAVGDERAAVYPTPTAVVPNGTTYVAGAQPALGPRSSANQGVEKVIRIAKTDNPEMAATAVQELFTGERVAVSTFGNQLFVRVDAAIAVQLDTVLNAMNGNDLVDFEYLSSHGATSSMPELGEISDEELDELEQSLTPDLASPENLFGE